MRRSSKNRVDTPKNLVKARYVSAIWSIYYHLYHRQAELTDLQTTSRGVERVVKVTITSTTLLKSMTVQRNDARSAQVFFNNGLKLPNIQSRRRRRAYQDPSQSLLIDLQRRDLRVVNRKILLRWDSTRVLENSLTSNSMTSLLCIPKRCGLSPNMFWLAGILFAQR